RLAVIGLSKTLSLELAPRKITVNAVCPGMTDTERLSELDRADAARLSITVADARARRAAAIPPGRLAAPSEIGAVVAFLCSRPAAYLTGAAIAVDGGLVRYPL